MTGSKPADGETAAAQAMEKRSELKEELWPSMKKYFSDTQKPHLIAILEPDLAEKVIAKVRRKTGGRSPYDVKAAVEEAVRKWAEEP